MFWGRENNYIHALKPLGVDRLINKYIIASAMCFFNKDYMYFLYIKYFDKKIKLNLC